MKAQNTDAEYSGENVSRTDDYNGDESEWDSEQFVQSTDNECAREGCESHTTVDGALFCNFCWMNRVLPETDVSAYTSQPEALGQIGDIEQIVSMEG